MIDIDAWRQAIQKPEWYITLYPELKSCRKKWEENPDSAESKNLKKAVRTFFEQALDSGDIALGQSGQNLDAERLPIDTIVIHHTSSKPGYTIPYMNAVQMLNVYIPYFNNPVGPGEAKLKGQALWSNHVRKGRPVFYLYHWLMRMDGSFERLLEDHELGWHAANWDINRRSVAICLDNDYENSAPNPEVLRRLATFISENYPHIPVGAVRGHREVSKKSATTCPGEKFVGGWKEDLLQLLSSA